MMKRMFGLAVALGSVLFLVEPSVRADSRFPPYYFATGQITITGNNTCSPAPCREIIDVSFNISFLDNHGTPNWPFVSNIIANGSGPLGTFAPFLTPDLFVSEQHNFFPIIGQFGDEVDLHVGGSQAGSGTPPIFPTVGSDGGDLYSCISTPCIEDFAKPGSHGGIGVQLPVSSQFSVTQVSEVPEPSSLSFLVFALTGMGWRLRKRSS
jgi:hypothetical protein